MTPPLELLDPTIWDRLREGGRGRSARMLRAGRRAVKVAHPGERYRKRLRREVELLEELRTWPAIPSPPVLAARSDARAFVRPWVYGEHVLELMRSGAPLPQGLVAQMIAVHRDVERFREERGVVLDFSPANLVFRRGRLVLVDGGERLAPSPFVGVRSETLPDVFAEYLRQRDELDGAAQPRPFLPPPSGRCHVEVAVGRLRGERLLWTNVPFLRRAGLPLDRAQLRSMSLWATHATPATHELVATRYQDAPEKDAARGDGRSLYVAELDATNGDRFEALLKGAGPTPLAWVGNEFHEDGFVSFPRTLWETTVCDELARLSFQTPEVGAIASTGKTTVDNTRVQWPAAAALRLAHTQTRLGHLVRQDDDADACRGLLRWAGATVVRPDFDPERPTHLRQLALNFARRFGEDTGRSDALCVHCFNPTMGNVRLDGHLIDFSTVRFHRHTLPQYAYMNDRRRVQEHKGALRKLVPLLLTTLRGVSLIDEDEHRRLSSRCLTLFDAAYVRGYLRGLLTLLDLEQEAEELRLDGAAARTLVSDATRLRAQRASAFLDFPFWKQRCPAPLFDLEARVPDMLSAHRDGEAEPWRALRSRFDGDVTDFAAGCGRELWASLERVLGRERLAQARGLRWRQVVRPFVEPERLAALCYGRSTPGSFREWKRHISTSARLPRGRYAAADAQLLSAARGSIRVGEVCVAGLTPELRDGLCDRLAELFSDRLRGVYVGGPRVATTGLLIEGGADGSGGDALVVRVHVDGELAEIAVAEQLAEVGCPFPVEVEQGRDGVRIGG